MITSPPYGNNAKDNFPTPVEAALEAERSGSNSTVAHLREDRRHIQEKDIWALRKALAHPLTMEMAITDPMESIALDVAPHRVCLVPEKRQELTTEGGLDVLAHRALLAKKIPRFQAKKIEVSLFIDAQPEHIQCAKDLGADCIELGHDRYDDKLFC